MSKTTNRAALVALTLQSADPIECEECGALVFHGESFFHDSGADAATCSVICAGAIRARGNLRPAPFHF